MGTTTPNMGIYVPSAGEQNFEQSYLQGMMNIDLHDHTGAPNKGVPLGSAGIADGSITREKLNANVVLTGGGLAVDAGSPNALKVDGVLLGIFNLASTGYVVKTGGATAASRSIQGTADEIAITNGDGVAGNTAIGMADNPIVPGTASLTVPVGTTAQRPGTPTEGMIRYNTDLNVMEYYENGAWLSAGVRAGTVVQVQVANITSAVNCTTIIPQDDTIPQITEGDEVLTVAITPKYATSLLMLEANLSGIANQDNRGPTMALFQDAITDALAASFVFTGVTTGQWAGNGTSSWTGISGSTSARTFRLRVGPPAAGGFVVNGAIGPARRFGGVASTTLRVWEIAQ